MRGFLLGLVSTCLFLSAASANAAEEDWQPSFARAFAAGHFAAEGLVVMVVPAGAPHPELAPAKSALARVLRDVGRVKTLFDEAAVGDVRGLDDGSVLAKLRAFPVDRLLVLRVYPGAAEKPPSALVTVYGHDHALIEAVHVEADGAAAQRGTAALPKPPEEPELDEAALAARYPDWLTLGELDVHRYPVVLTGEDHRALEGGQIYAVLGHADLATQFYAADALRSTLLTIGVGTAASGLLLFVGSEAAMLLGTAVLVNTSTDDYASAAPLAYAPLIGMAVGAALIPVGGVVTLLGALVKPHPVRRDELLAMIEAHNQGLLGGAGATTDSMDHDVE